MVENKYNRIRSVCRKNIRDGVTLETKPTTNQPKHGGGGLTVKTPPHHQHQPNIRHLTSTAETVSPPVISRCTHCPSEADKIILVAYFSTSPSHSVSIDISLNILRSKAVEYVPNSSNVVRNQDREEEEKEDD